MNKLNQVGTFIFETVKLFDKPFQNKPSHTLGYVYNVGLGVIYACAGLFLLVVGVAAMIAFSFFLGIFIIPIVVYGIVFALSSIVFFGIATSEHLKFKRIQKMQELCIALDEVELNFKLENKKRSGAQYYTLLLLSILSLAIFAVMIYFQPIHYTFEL